MPSQVIALIVASMAYFVFGASIPTALFLFFPLNALVRDVAKNDGLGIVRSLVFLACFPVMTLIAGHLHSIASATFGKSPESIRSLQGLDIAVKLACCAVTMGVLSLLASLVASITGGLTLPGPLHVRILKVIDICGCLLALFAIISGVRYFDERHIGLTSAVKFAVACGSGVAFALALRRVLAKNYNARLGPPSVKTGRAGRTNHIRLREEVDERLSDVQGMDDAKEQIALRVIEPVKQPNKARLYGLKPGGGVLLYGPPGTGKTMLARAVAGELGLPFYTITAADVFGKYVGESERNMRAIFAEIRKNRLSVVFIDELETLFPARSGDIHETTRKVISVILQELDGLERTKNPILLIGATNVPWMVDEAFLRPGRFDVKIFVGLPDEKAREDMVAAALAKGSIPREEGLAGHIASNTKNYSGADLNGVVDRMRQIAYSHNAQRYTRDIADAAIASVAPTANGALLDQIHDWEAQSSGGVAKFSPTNAISPESGVSVTLADVAGMDDVKRQIAAKLIEPIRNRTLAKHYGVKPGGGMLLYGPPGTGKTMLARAVAGELDLPFYSITSADIFGKYVGDSERNVKRLFRDIRKNDLSVVFIDELETLFPKRTGDIHETTRKVISLILQELDGLDNGKNPMLLIGATNVPWMVDEAFLRPGRFDVRIFVDLPDMEARRYMVFRALDSGEVRYQEGLDSHIAAKTERMSGADLKGILEQMRQTAFMRRLPYYTKALADEILADYSPAPMAQTIAQIKQWERACLK